MDKLVVCRAVCWMLLLFPWVSFPNSHVAGGAAITADTQCVRSSVSSSGTAMHPAGTAPPRAGNPLLLVLAHSSLSAALSDHFMALKSSTYSETLMEFAMIKIACLTLAAGAPSHPLKPSHFCQRCLL